MDETIKEEVRERAVGRCEYCHLPEAHVLTPFQVEHVVAKQHRGRDTLGNLAYACLRCNLHKGPNLTGIDPKTKNSPACSTREGIAGHGTSVGKERCFSANRLWEEPQSRFSLSTILSASPCVRN